MNKLRAYLKTLSKDEQEQFAKDCGTTLGYFFRAISANQKLGAAICVLIETNSNSQVTRKDLRGDWDSIWPELRDVA
jgi:DNA-binding transcriptional regulator YdaS (Cro superfamily)